MRLKQPVGNAARISSKLATSFLNRSSSSWYFFTRSTYKLYTNTKSFILFSSWPFMHEQRCMFDNVLQKLTCWYFDVRSLFSSSSIFDSTNSFSAVSNFSVNFVKVASSASNKRPDKIIAHLAGPVRTGKSFPYRYLVNYLIL